MARRPAQWDPWIDDDEDLDPLESFRREVARAMAAGVSAEAVREEFMATADRLAGAWTDLEMPRAERQRLLARAFEVLEEVLAGQASAQDPVSQNQEQR